MDDQLFFNILRNIYIRNEITIQLLFIVNKYKIFTSIKELKDYQWIDFVESISYRGEETMGTGDISVTNSIISILNCSSLKEVLPNTIPRTVKDFSINFTTNNHFSFIRDTIPTSLTSLTITSLGGITICSNVLPETLKSIIILAPKLIIEDGSLPNSLESLDLIDIEEIDFKQSLFKDFEKSNLIDLSIQCENGTIGDQSFSSRLKSLIYSLRGYSSPTLIKKDFFQLPSSMEFLGIRSKNETQFFEDGVIPNTIKTLHISLENSNQKISKNLGIPDSVENLEIHINTFRPNHGLIEPFSIPKSVKKMVMDGYYNIPFKLNVIPQNLKELTINCNFNQPIDQPGIFPTSLTSLVLPKNFNQPILPGVLPSSLEYLCFSSPLLHPINSSVLPLSLKTLHLKNGLDINDIISNHLPINPYLIKFQK
ncbi:hypothetical protein ACTA71_002038 [Dictyostelium dimigraforme]